MKRMILPAVLLLAAVLWYLAEPSNHGPVTAESAGTAIVSAASLRQPAQITKPVSRVKALAKSTTPSDAVEMINIPSAFVFGDTREVEAADSTEVLFSRFGDADRDVLQAFSDKYANIFSFEFKQQYEWMVRNGYPTPADILSAQEMSDDELRAATDAMNGKAALLYLDRLMNEFDESFATSGLSREAFRQSDKYGKLAVELDYYAAFAQGVESPAAAYTLFRFDRDFKDDPYAALADLMVANNSGSSDKRAGYFATNHYLPSEPALNANIMDAMGAMYFASTFVATSGHQCIVPHHGGSIPVLAPPGG